MQSILVPEYYKKFQCIGGACEDTCCAGWTITVDKPTYQKYKKVKEPKLKELLENKVKRDRKSKHDVAYAKIVLDENNLCPMVLEDGLCKIHKELGEKYLCNTCVTYPRHITKVGTVIEKSLTLSCPEAARLALLNKDGIGFEEVQEPINARGTLAGILSLEKHPYFWDLRMFIISLIQNRQQSLEIRLMLLGIFFQKLEEIRKGDYKEQLPILMQSIIDRFNDVDYIASLSKIDRNLHYQLNLAKDLIRYRLSNTISSKKYLDILNQLIEGVSLGEGEKKWTIEESIEIYKAVDEKIYRPFISEHEYILENYIVNYIYKNLFPYDKGTLFESYMVLVINVSLIKIHLIGMAAKQNQLTTDMFIECIQQLSKTIEHNSAYLNGVCDGMKKSGYATLAHMCALNKN